MLSESKAFSTQLYQEHLGEASFLYEQRLTLLEDPTATWLDIEDFEDRFEPHIDGLVIGEDLALEVCKQQAGAGDFGEFHAATRVFCRQNKKNMVSSLMDQINPNDEEKLQAVTDALIDEMPPGWFEDFVNILNSDNIHWHPFIARMIGFRRMPYGQKLIDFLNRTDERQLGKTIWALGRLREKKAHIPIYNSGLKHTDESVCAEAALALLRLGDPQTVSHCMNRAASERWPFLALGLGGSPQVLTVLRQLATSESAIPNSLLALGLLGDKSTIDILLDRLPIDELAECSALALYFITGAELFEEVFIPEEIDKDELFDDELEKLEKGESLYPPGEEPGITINRISQKVEDWQKWWAENSSRFDPKIRYRNGKPYAPDCLLENLQSEKSPNIMRKLAYEELVIRYGIDFPFETDMQVVQQRQAIARYKEWIDANQNRFKPGKWYFAGQLQTL